MNKFEGKQGKVQYHDLTRGDRVNILYKRMLIQSLTSTANEGKVYYRNKLKRIT